MADALCAAYGEDDYAIYRVLDQALGLDLSANGRMREQHTNRDAYVRHWGLQYGAAAAGR